MNGEDRTEMSALRAEVRSLAAEQRSLSTEIRVLSLKLEAIPDHEERLRGLEKWKNALPVGTLLLMATTAVSVIALFMRS